MESMNSEANSIIFLDIDGVLNTRYDRSIDSKKIKYLNELYYQIIKFDAVITSSKRKLYPLKNIQKLFKNENAIFEIIDKTPISNTGIRGVEIDQWMSQNINIDSKYKCSSSNYFTYAILDDDSDMLLKHKEHLFLCDNSIGLTENIVYKIGRFLKSRKNLY
jgi:hypothetical protein